MIQNFLDDIGIRDFSDHPQGATASRAQGDIDIEDTLESLCPGERCEE